MDHHRFDDLTRSLATGLSRRRALHTLAGGALGSLLGLAGLREATAACRLAGQRCNDGNRCCPGAKCASNGRCKCKISQNFFACEGPNTRCVNIGTSEKHCGGCGFTPCAEEENCINGICLKACEDGLHDGLETDTDCGGPDCPKCGLNKKCNSAGDCDGTLRCRDRPGDGTTQKFCVECTRAVDDEFCQALYGGERPFCEQGLCRADPRCTNTTKDGGETDIDCGGPHCVRCANGKQCFLNDDCVSDVCDRSADPNEAGVCRAPAQGACEEFDSICQGSNIDNGCNGDFNCACRRNLNLTSSVCCSKTGGTCHPCAVDADCTDRTGPGSTCTEDCNGVCPGGTSCVPPCPTAA